MFAEAQGKAAERTGEDVWRGHQERQECCRSLGEEFPRKMETTTVDQLHGATADVRFQSTLNTQEDKREVLEPV